MLLDGSTDKDNIDDEVFLVVWCDRDASDQKIHTRMAYLIAFRPQAVTGQGLFDVLKSGLQCLGIQEISLDHCKQLVGIGTDGASANIAASGLKGLVEEKCP